MNESTDGFPEGSDIKDRDLQPYLICAVGCGVLPLVMGATLFISWLGTEPYHSVEAGHVMAGVWTLALGTLVVFGGAVSLFEFARISRSRHGSYPVLPLGLVGLLLFANFPVATGILGTVGALATQDTVVVVNETENPLKDVWIAGAGCKEGLGTLQAGERATCSFWARGEGMVYLKTRGYGPHRNARLFQPSESFLGERMLVRVTPKGIQVAPL